MNGRGQEVGKGEERRKKGRREEKREGEKLVALSTTLKGHETAAATLREPLEYPPLS